MDAPVSLHSLLAPAELKCPLSNRLFVDPVVAGTFGKTQSVSVCVLALVCDIPLPCDRPTPSMLPEQYGFLPIYRFWSV